MYLNKMMSPTTECTFFESFLLNRYKLMPKVNRTMEKSNSSISRVIRFGEKTILMKISRHRTDRMTIFEYLKKLLREPNIAPMVVDSNSLLVSSSASRDSQNTRSIQSKMTSPAIAKQSTTTRRMTTMLNFIELITFFTMLLRHLRRLKHFMNLLRYRKRVQLFLSRYRLSTFVILYLKTLILSLRR